jgi:hypothetical protein
MKRTALCTFLVLTTMMVLGPIVNLEARPHCHSNVSMNIGNVFPSYPKTYVVEKSRPAYVEQHHYYHPYGETVTVYREPQTVTVYHEPPAEKVYVYEKPNPLVPFGLMALGVGLGVCLSR